MYALRCRFRNGGLTNNFQMISAASAQIESKGGENLKTTVIKNGVPTVVPDYGAVQGILMGSVVAFCVIMIVIGPECVILLAFSP